MTTTTTRISVRHIQMSRGESLEYQLPVKLIIKLEIDETELSRTASEVVMCDGAK